MADKPSNSDQEDPQNEEEVIMGGGSGNEPPKDDVAASTSDDNDINDDDGEFSAGHVDVSDRISKDTVKASDLLDQVLKIDNADFIPWEDVVLPSGGAYYNGLIPNGMVRVKAMGIHAEKILATQRLAQSGQSIDYLFKNCVEFPNVDGKELDPGDLLAGDRVFLLYVLRGLTHGNIYEFMLKCPTCDHTGSYSYDLNELADTIQRAKPELGSEPFRVNLPFLSESTGRHCYVLVRFIRGKDSSFVAKRIKFNKNVRSSSSARKSDDYKNRHIVIDQTMTENLNLVVEGFGSAETTDDVKDKLKIKQLIDKLHAKDTSAIREFLRDNAPGIDTTIEMECSGCQAVFNTELPITESFFRPASNKRS